MSNITFTAGSVPPSHSAKELFWRNTLTEFLASGQSVLSFCQARGLKAPTFYTWRLKLAKRDRQDISPTPAGSRSTQPAFVPVVVEPPLAGAAESIQASA